MPDMLKYSSSANNVSPVLPEQVIMTINPSGLRDQLENQSVCSGLQLWHHDAPVTWGKQRSVNYSMTHRCLKQ